VIIMSFVMATPEEIAGHKARVVIADKSNRVAETVEHPSTLESYLR
jgi:aspartate 1-decarboxylase